MTENTQKIELLEAQCREYQERENSLKLLNNSIMVALNELSAESEKNNRKQLNKEIEFIRKKNEFDVRELKTLYENRIKSLMINVKYIIFFLFLLIFRIRIKSWRMLEEISAKGLMRTKEKKKR